MTIDAKIITASFLHPIVQILQGNPAYKHIYKVSKFIIANDGSVQSTLGGSGHGLHGLKRIFWGIQGSM
eukprot:1964659-Ditylum_brightwellii.AAC.1